MSPVTKVHKRDGSIVIFEKDKIFNAIWKAAQAVGGKDRKRAQYLTDEVIKILNQKFNNRSIPSVEEIQDIVEKVLIENGHAKTAKAYILYRDQHRRMRDFSEILKGSTKLVQDYLDRMDWRVKENSNMAYSLQGLNNYIASAVISEYWLSHIYPPEICKAHKEGDFHIHDLGILAAYCCGWDLKDLLLKGFGGVSGKIESKPPKHFRTALGQIVNFFYTLQGETAGAEAFSNFDTFLAPFIYYDKLNYKEIKQAFQEFLFNMNVPTRVGFQTPFTNITFDLTVPDIMKNDSVIIAGKLQKKKYKNFQKEMDLLNKAFAEVMSEGDSKDRVFTFPIPTYNITKDFKWDNKNYKPIFEMTAKYGIPYFSNFINSDMKPDDTRSMCCRLRLDNRELRKRGGGLFGANPLTGSIGVVTLNMPRIGYLSKTRREFLKRVENLMNLAHESLVIKRKVVERFTEQGLYPYSKFYLSEVKQSLGEYWKNHFNTIGLIGMNEAVLNFMNKNLSNKEAREFTLQVMDFMREKLSNFQKETDMLYNLEATPGEGTSFRFAKMDKEKFADIVVANEKSFEKKNTAPFYTNSTHLPVNYTNDLFKALDLQDPLQTKYTGGTVMHFFLGERLPSWQSCRNLVKKIAENYHLPYYTITPTFSICPKHGYLAGEHKYCPKCDDEIGYSAYSKKSKKNTIKKSTIKIEKKNNKK